MRIVIVTGMSGAGKSSALNVFEDMGYYSMDNLPPQLMLSFLELAQSSKEPINKVAVGLDIRGRSFFESLKKTKTSLEDKGVDVSILFLTASDEILVRRYKELRRPHPMDKAGNIYDGIQREKASLESIRNGADHIIDSSHLTLGQLKEELESIYFNGLDSANLFISIVSFGFKHGILLDADLVFDVRFIPNPYYIESLQKLNGGDTAVQDYVFAQKETQTFLDKTFDLLYFLIPNYLKEGKRTLTIGVGCTGGKHRSVALALALGRELEKEYKVFVKHRDHRFW